MKLVEIHDHDPTLVAIMRDLLRKGRTIYWGSNQKTIDTITVNPYQTVLGLRKPRGPGATYNIPHDKIDSWELVPEKGEFRLKLDIDRLVEGVDDEPLLLRLVKQRLLKGDEVGIRLTVGSPAAGRMHFKHAGDVFDIELQTDISKDLRRLTNGNPNAVIISFRKRVGGLLTSIVLDPSTFDELYQLTPFDVNRKDLGWEITDQDDADAGTYYASQ